MENKELEIQEETVAAETVEETSTQEAQTGFEGFADEAEALKEAQLRAEKAEAARAPKERYQSSCLAGEKLLASGSYRAAELV